jgi:hypothetical protein
MTLRAIEQGGRRVCRYAGSFTRRQEREFA